MEITAAILIVNFFLSHSNCQESEDPRSPPPVPLLQRVYNTVKYNSESVDLLLGALESLNLQPTDGAEYERNLRNTKRENKALYRFIVDLYERCRTTPRRGVVSISREEIREWEHVENYSLALKETMEKIHGRTFNAATDSADCACTLTLPVGPPRNVWRVPLQSTKRMTAASELSNLHSVASNVLEALFGRFFVFEFISYALADWSENDDPFHKDEVAETFRSKYDIFWKHLKDLLNHAISSPDLEVDDAIAKKSKSLTALAMAIRDTTTALDLRMYGKK